MVYAGSCMQTNIIEEARKTAHALFLPSEIQESSSLSLREPSMEPTRPAPWPVTQS